MQPGKKLGYGIRQLGNSTVCDLGLDFGSKYLYLCRTSYWEKVGILV